MVYRPNGIFCVLWAGSSRWRGWWCYCHVFLAWQSATPATTCVPPTFPPTTTFWCRTCTDDLQTSTLRTSSSVRTSWRRSKTAKSTSLIGSTVTLHSWSHGRGRQSLADRQTHATQSILDTARTPAMTDSSICPVCIPRFHATIHPSSLNYFGVDAPRGVAGFFLGGGYKVYPDRGDPLRILSSSLPRFSYRLRLLFNITA